MYLTSVKAKSPKTNVKITSASDKPNKRNGAKPGNLISVMGQPNKRNGQHRGNLISVMGKPRKRNGQLNKRNEQLNKRNEAPAAKHLLP